MSSSWMWFVFFWAIGTIIMGFVEGSQGIATTALSASVTSTAVELPVASVTGFEGDGVVIIGQETIRYQSVGSGAVNCPVTGAAACFKSVTRGVGVSEPAAHSSGRRVYNGTSGVLDSLIGYQMASSMGTAEGIGAVLFKPVAFGYAFYKMLIWDWPALNGLPIGGYLRIPLVALSVGALVALFQLVTASGIFGLLRRS